MSSVQSDKTAAIHRSAALLSNMISMLSMGKLHFDSLDEIATWNLAQYQEAGYFSNWMQLHKDNLRDSFIEKLIFGRRHVYDQIEVEVSSNNSTTVRSKIWYLSPEHPAFFYYNLEPTEFLHYIRTFTVMYARHHSVELSITHEDDGDCIWELVTIA